MEWSTPSRRSKYPWDEWTDGTYRLVFFEVDFTCALVKFQNQLHMRAGVHELRVATKRIPVRHPFFGNETAGILFRFLRPGDEDFSFEAALPHLREQALPSALEIHARLFAGA